MLLCVCVCVCVCLCVYVCVCVCVHQCMLSRHLAVSVFESFTFVCVKGLYALAPLNCVSVESRRYLGVSQGVVLPSIMDNEDICTVCLDKSYRGSAVLTGHIYANLLSGAVD